LKKKKKKEENYEQNKEVHYSKGGLNKANKANKGQNKEVGDQREEQAAGIMSVVINMAKNE